jgi:hypothetical protein
MLPVKTIVVQAPLAFLRSRGQGSHTPGWLLDEEKKYDGKESDRPNVKGDEGVQRDASHLQLHFAHLPAFLVTYIHREISWPMSVASIFQRMAHGNNIAVVIQPILIVGSKRKLSGKLLWVKYKFLLEESIATGLSIWSVLGWPANSARKDVKIGLYGANIGSFCQSPNIIAKKKRPVITNRFFLTVT